MDVHVHIDVITTGITAKSIHIVNLMLLRLLNVLSIELTETSNVLTLSTVDAQTVNRNNNSDSIVVGSVIAVILVIALASVLATVIGLLILWRKRRRIIFKGGKSINAERDMLQETLVGLINHTYQDTSILVSKDFNNPLYGGLNLISCMEFCKYNYCSLLRRCRRRNYLLSTIPST